MNSNDMAGQAIVDGQRKQLARLRVVNRELVKALENLADAVEKAPLGYVLPEREFHGMKAAVLGAIRVLGHAKEVGE
jgi:hypothetical protein